MPQPLALEAHGDPSRLRILRGPLITLAVCAALTGARLAGLDVPNTAVPLVLTVVYAAYAGGVLSGLVSAVLTVVYVAIPEIPPEGIGAMGEPTLLRLAILSVTALLTVAAGEVARRRIEAAASGELRREREFSRSLLDTMQDGLNVVSVPDRRIIEVNPRFCELIGYARRELVGQIAPFAYWAPEERDQIEATLARAERGEISETDVHLRRKDGSEVTAILSRAPLRDARGEVTAVVSTYKDATERARAEAALRESEDRYRAVTDTASDAIISIDEDSRVIFANRAVERTFGYPPQELVGQSLTVLMPEQLRQRHRDGIRRFLTTGERSLDWQGIRVDGLRADGTSVPLEVSFGEAVHEGRRVFTGIVRDISDRILAQEAVRQSEERLQDAQRIEAIGRLAGGIAHDFNNLLTAITGYSDLVLSDLPASSPVRGDVQEIRRTADRATVLTRQLLAFGRRQVLEPKVLDINRVVAGIEPMIERLIGETIQVVTILEPRAHRIEADPGQLDQVILNLCVNARDAMPHGGLLTIETSNTVLDESHPLTGGGVTPGPYVKLSVSDTGQGIDETTRSHLFEPFYTTKERGKGTGLGLATVYGIVTQSGGTVEVESEPGRGATFSIYLPDATPTSLDEEPEAPSPRSLRGSETVLLVEDDPAVRALARQVLLRYGYTVLEAPVPSQAILIAERHDGQIDLLLTDVVMPEMPGPEVARRLRALRPEIRVLFMSGYAEESIVGDGVIGRDSNFLQKPFGPQTLAVKLREMLDRDGSGGREPATASTATDASGVDRVAP